LNKTDMMFARRL